MTLIWHYTSLQHGEKIFEEELLRVSEAERKFGLKPALWFSLNSFWEPTATKMIMDENGQYRQMTLEEQYSELGMIRIGILFTKELTSWAKYKHASKINPILYNNMEEIGIEKGGNPLDWYCSFKDIPSKNWETVEQFDGDTWVNIIKSR